MTVLTVGGSKGGRGSSLFNIFAILRSALRVLSPISRLGKCVLRCFLVRMRMISVAACLRCSSADVSGNGIVSGRKTTVSASRTDFVVGMKHFTQR